MRSAVLLVSFALGGSAVQSFAGALTPTTSSSTQDRAAQLIQRAQGLPDVAPEDAKAAAMAALLVETEAVPAELLLAIAWGESRFIPTTVTGRACGLVQTIGASRAECRLMQNPLVGLAAGAAELERWLVAARGNYRLALLGYACGWSGLRGGAAKTQGSFGQTSGGCAKQAWPGWVLRRARGLGLTQKSTTLPRVFGRTST